jgi:gluconolactonase
MNAGLEALATGFRWIEGPVWMGDWNCLLFQDLPRNRTMWWDDDTGLHVYRSPSEFANGQTRDRQGRLVACSHRARSVVRIEHDGRMTTLADRFDGKRLNSPNDVVVASDGGVWFSDPPYGIANDSEGGRQAQEQRARLYRIDPVDGRVEIGTELLDGPNGLAFSPDERRLYVAETGDQTKPDPAQYIRVFDVAPGNTLVDGGIFHKIEPGYADGFRVDEDGNLWSSAADGVHCIDPSGKRLGKILIPKVVANVTFGGAFKNRLFIGASDTLYAIFLNTRGVQTP